MPLLWTDALALIDADLVVLRDGKRVRCEFHDGEPAVALSRLLAGTPVPRFQRLTSQRRLSVLIGSPWAHAAMLPWQPGILKAEEWNEYARVIFADQGVPQSALRIGVEAAPFGRSRLSFALDAPLFDALETATVDAGWRFAHCRDLLSAAVARHLRSLPDDCVFALAELDSVTCLMRRDGYWADAAKQSLLDAPSLTSAIAIASLLCSQPVGLPAFVATAPTHAVSASDGMTALDAIDARVLPREAIAAALANTPGRATAHELAQTFESETHEAQAREDSCSV